MDYLKLFQNHSEYEAFVSGGTMMKPNVSHCIQENEVHYNPYIDLFNGHEYVEIAGKKWATMNVGAANITDSGLYFQWGDTQGYTAAQVGSGNGQKYFDSNYSDYKWYDGSNFTKYTNSDGLTTLELSDDAARVNWGGAWRIPTISEFDALLAAVNTTWTTNYQGSGVAGAVCTDKNDNSKVLFFPSVGVCGDGAVLDVGNGYGSYLTNSIGSFGEDYIHSFGGEDDLGWGNIPRYYGNPVRGIVG